jgi:hypothetical protein
MINLLHNVGFYFFNCDYVFRDRYNDQENYFLAAKALGMLAEYGNQLRPRRENLKRSSGRSAAPALAGALRDF